MSNEEVRMVLRKLRVFVEYARDDLPEGRPEMGDEMPRPADADVLMAEIDAVMALINSSDPGVH